MTDHNPDEGPRQPAQRTLFLLIEAAKHLEGMADDEDSLQVRLRLSECADACKDAAFALSQDLAADVRADFEKRWKAALLRPPTGVSRVPR